MIDSKPTSSSDSPQPKKHVKRAKDKPQVKLSSTLKPGINTEGYLNFKPEDIPRALNQMTLRAADKELVEKAVIGPGFEQTHVPKATGSRRQQRKLSRHEREKTAGKGWYNLPATEQSEETKRDLFLLQMRSSLDPKRFYKRNDLQSTSKYFQMGTVIEHATDFHSSRLTRKERKNTLVEELLADAEFRKWNKKKYVEALKQNPYYLRMARKKEAQKKGAEGLKQRNRKRPTGALPAREDKDSQKAAKKRAKHAKRLKKKK
jgi:hypothetical protein